MQPEDIDRLRAADPDPRLDVTDRHFAKALRIFLSTTNTSQATYDAIRSSMVECYPEDPFLSFRQVKRRVEQLTGVVPIFHDMCRDTCVGFTGPFADYDQCPICGKDRYRSGTREPHRQFITIPLGPVVQALYGSVSRNSLTADSFSSFRLLDHLHHPMNIPDSIDSCTFTLMLPRLPR